jgi:hypothetical protein
MKSLMRRNLLLLMLGAAAVAFTVSFDAPAFAKDGASDDSSSDSSGSSGGDHDSGGGDGDLGSGSHGSDDGGNSGSGSHDSSGDDNDSGDDGDDSAGSDGNGNGGGGNAARPSIEIAADAATRAGLLNGTLVAVDNLGRPLEVEAENRNGQSVLIAKPHGGDAKRRPGPITGFDIIPAAQAPAHS